MTSRKAKRANKTGDLAARKISEAKTKKESQRDCAIKGQHRGRRVRSKI